MINKIMRMKNLFLCTLTMCLCVAFSSCDKIKVIDLHSNTADFVVKNLTTGDAGKNLGTTLDVKNGDVLEIVYTPDKKYQKYKWTVDFELFAKEIQTVEKRPYSILYTVRDMSPGEYMIECMAAIKDKNVYFGGIDYGKVKVKVNE